MDIDEARALKADLESGAETLQTPTTPAPRRPPRARRRRRLIPSRRRARWTMEVTHRWLALVLGIALLAITTSGAVLLYLPELEQVAHPSLFRTTSGTPISATRALAIARANRSGIVPDAATLRDGAWIVDGTVRGRGDRPQQLHIDAATGRVLGLGSLQGGVLGWLANFHDCGLGCAGFPGYTPALAHPLPLLGNPDMTVGALIVTVTGAMLAWLVISGLWLWWPKIRRFARGFTIRRRRGGYALNYDLHKVIGIAALPFLAMWAITGSGFYLKQVEQGWYGLLPGTRPPDYVAPASAPRAGAQPITVAQAERAAARRLPGSTLRTITLPAAGDRTGAYDISVSDGFDPRGDGLYQGDVDVAVDRYSGRATVAYPTTYSHHRPLAQSIWQDWQFAGHAGEPVDGWWRLIWLAFGLAPLALAVTGVITWLTRRRKRRARRGSARPLPA